ncbi:ubiquitinyl hydrolase 1 [Pseudocyphellaria aurata]|nr:ubiquitinyl hydrolase 1 [Pseudocyphellaria aurata]
MATTADAPPDYNIESPDVPKTTQRFVPLENNPEVMSTLVHKLGLSDSLSFHDVYSLDDPSLLAFVPRPVQALLLVFPVSKGYEAGRMAEDAPLPVYNSFGPDEEVLWFRQTIGNACGMMGLLHSACNGGARDLIATNTPLAELIASAIPLPPTPRSKLIETSTAIAEAHAAAAAQGDTAAPLASANVEHHFVAFIKSAQGNLWELDGRRKGPLNRGKLDTDDDPLSEKALQLGVKRFLAVEAEEGLGADLRFSLLALAPTLD